MVKNWRPISLLCSDYKILTKALSIRLRSIISTIIHEDQTCSIPNRQIFDNIHLLRDSIFYANDTDTPLGIVALDQEKAFDRVHHDYLLQTLHSFGFGSRFIHYIKTLYTDIQSLIKINNTLTAPLKINRGIRQGCSLSLASYM